MAIRKPILQTILLAATLVGLTGLHLGYRHVSAATEKEGSGISALEVGVPFPALALRPLAREAGTADPPVPAANVCRLVILFSSTCEHCHTAARRDAAMADSMRLPTLWVSHTDDAAAHEFAALLDETAPVLFGGPDAFQRLKVRGVPAAFLVSRQNEVRWVGAYIGGPEGHRLLKERCDP